MNHKLVAWGACLCWLAGSSGSARAEDATPEAAPTPTSEARPPEVTSSAADGVFTTQGTVSIEAPRKAVFAVLMDYRHMASFITSLKSSAVSAHHGKELTVAQEATGKAGPFSKDVHTILTVTSKPTSKISFLDTEKKDFDQYSGAWTLTGAGNTTTVSYQLTAKPKGMAPEGLTEGAFKKSIETMLVEVRTEVEKRAAATR